jgi:archaemetzincin
MIRLRVAPLEGLDAALLASLAAALRSGYGIEVDVTEPLGPPDFALDVERNQSNAPEILKSLLARDRDQGKLLAVTARDLFIPMLSFVYGQAQLDGRVAVVSMARLSTEFYGMPPDPDLLDVRARKEALHEVGHLFGLLHCPDPNCAMALSTGIRQLDRKQPALCAGCSALASGKRSALERAR